jgi:glycosyltransferase involved in cell wall biosynthesis
LRVGIFTPSYPGITGEGGIGTYTCHLAHGLTSRGHTVHVVTPGPANTDTSDGLVAVHTVECKHLPVLDRFLPGAGACYRVSRAMRRIVAGHKLDLVEFPNWEGLGVLFCLRRPAPVVVRLHTSSLETQLIDGAARNRPAKWDVRREQLLAWSADALVTHSEAHRATMADELRLDMSGIRVVPHGIRVAPSFRRPSPADGDPTIVYLGRLEKRKGTFDLLQAIPQVLPKVPRARFVLIGADRPHCPGGRTHAEFIQQALAPEVRGRVTLLGRLPDAEVDHWLQRADLFVAPSLYESFGLIFLEAMRWGTPVIGTTAGGIPEIIEDGRTGLLVPPSNPAALAAAITGLLQDEGRRRLLGEAGRCHVERCFSTERMAKDVEDLYCQTIRRWRRGEVSGCERRTSRGRRAAA